MFQKASAFTAALALATVASAAGASQLPDPLADMVVGDSWNVRLPGDLASAAHAYDEAQVKSDKAALERLLADDYVLVNSSGAIETKRQFIADQTAPGYRLDPFTVDRPLKKVFGDTAILGGVATLTGTDGGKPYSVRLQFTDVWRKLSGRWQVVYTQAARAPSN